MVMRNQSGQNEKEFDRYEIIVKVHRRLLFLSRLLKSSFLWRRNSTGMIMQVTLNKKCVNVFIYEPLYENFKFGAVFF